MSYVTLASTPLNWQDYSVDPSASYNGGGFASNLALYKKLGSNRILLNEAWGWSVYDNSNPMAPARLSSKDVRLPVRVGPNGGELGWYSVPTGGDGQSATQGFCISPDGQRLAAYMGGASVPHWEIIADPDGNGFKLEKAISLPAGQGQVMQQINGRYIVYCGFYGIRAADVTYLPSSGLMAPTEEGELSSTLPDGSILTVRENFLTYVSDSGVIVVNISNPGPAGNIMTNMAFTTVTPAILGLVTGQRIQSYAASVDPTDSNKLWLLIGVLGPSPTMKYYLVSVTSSLVITVIGTPWIVPDPTIYSQNVSIANSLTINNGVLYVMIWNATGAYGLVNWLYSTSTDQWANINTSSPPNKFQIPANLTGFGVGHIPSCISVDTSIYMYLPCGPAAYVIPLTCVISGGSGGPPAPPPPPPSGDQVVTFPLVSNYGLEMFMSGNGDALFKGIGGGTPISKISDATVPYYQVDINKGTGFSSLTRLVLGFDTSSLGANVTITGAKLQLYGYDFTDVADTTSIDIFTSDAPSSLFPFVASPNSLHGFGVDPSSISELYNSATTKVAYLGTGSFPSLPTSGWPEPPVTEIVLDTKSINTLDLTKFVLKTGIDSASAYPIVAAGIRIQKDQPPTSMGALDSVKLVITYTGTPGATTPTPPTNITATQLNGTTATVSWNDPISSGASSISEYDIITHDVLADAQVAGFIAGPSLRTSNISGLITNRTYDFYVFAKNANGSGGVGVSNSLTLTTGTPPPPLPPPGASLPGAPTNLTGVPGIGTVSLAWDTPTSDGGAAITGYKVSYTTSGLPEKFLSVGPVTNALLSGLANNTAYLVKVAAINMTGTGVYSAISSFVTSSQQAHYNLTSWPYFNGERQSFSIEFQEIVPQFNGITAISRDNTPTTLYTTPTEVYPAYEEVGKITLRSAKRKKDPTTHDGITDYYLPPGNTVVSAELQNLSYNLNICWLGLFTSPQPDVGYLQDILKFSGRPGDICKIYTKYQSYFSGPGAFETDHGLGGATEWKFNRVTVPPALELMPGWAYEYTHTRPFLRFDTRNLVETNSVTKAVLSFKKDPNCPIINPENITLSFVKVSDIVNDDNLTTADYNHIEATVLAILPLSDPTLQSGDRVSLTILDTSFIKPSGFSKISVVTQLENTTLPTDWTQITLQDVSLDLILDTSSTTPPGEVSYINAFAGNGQVSLAWGAPQINGGAAIISYTITNTNTGATTQIPAVTLQDNYTYDWIGLTNDTLYTFLITASNNKGTGQGTTVAATPSATPSLPGPVRYLSGHPKDGAAIVSWYPPTQVGSSAINAYYATNHVTGIVLSTLAPNTNIEFTGLNNDTTYTITVFAQNENGAGPESLITVTPTNGIVTPAQPTIANVYATNGAATLHWAAPTDTGGSPLTGWVVTLFVPASPTFVPVVFTLLDPTQLSLAISSLSAGNVYLLSVSAVNIAGIGVAAFSDLFTVSPYIKPQGVFVPTNYNYKKFFEAPVDLNTSSPTYLENLYPEDDEFYATHSAAYVQSDSALSYPIVLSPSFSTLYFSINTPITNTGPATYTEYALPLWASTGPMSTSVGTLTPELASQQINRAAATYNVPIIAEPLEGQRVSVRTQVVGDGATISLTTNRAQLNSANRIVFGETPTVADGFTEYPVKKHIPTPEYDTRHKKALVESRPWITVHNYDASRASLWYQQFDEHKGNCYNITLERNLRPNGVSIHYFDSNNNLVTLKDYLGDGRLLYRDKASTGPGDPVSFTYPSDVIQSMLDPSSSDPQVNNYGLINYTTGVISKLVFPTFTLNTGALYPTFKQSFILGNKVTWPLYFKDDMTLYLDVNGVTQQFVIPKNPLFNTFGAALPADDVVYSAQAVVDILKAKPAFRYAGLNAGVLAGQLWIRNVGNSGASTNLPINVGPTNTVVLTPNDSQFLDANGNIKSCNRMLFGIAPNQSPTSKVYFTYSYTNSDTSPYRYIWYQTPHFVLRSAIGPTQFTTKGHLDYLLNKLALFKPATTTLDNIEFVPSFEEIMTVKDEIRRYAGTGVSLPYIQINNRPPISTEMSGLVVSVTIQNPDEQEAILANSYTYL